jgi:hypothetical protein
LAWLPIGLPSPVKVHFPSEFLGGGQLHAGERAALGGGVRDAAEVDGGGGIELRDADHRAR